MELNGKLSESRLMSSEKNSINCKKGLVLHSPFKNFDNMKSSFKRHLTTFSWVFLIAFTTFSKTQTNISRSGNMILIDNGSDKYQLEICTSSMIRIRHAGPEGFEANEQLMVNHYEWEKVPFTMNDKKTEAEIKTDVLTAKITTNPFTIAFYTPDGILINRDVLSGEQKMNTPLPSCTKELQPGEHFFWFWRADGLYGSTRKKTHPRCWQRNSLRSRNGRL